MNIMEIIFENIKVNDLELLLYLKLELDKSKIKSSHFYDKTKKNDVEFHDIKSLTQYFDTSGTGNIYIGEINIGTVISNVMIIISFDKLYGDVVLNFNESEIITGDIESQLVRCDRIIQKLQSLYDSLEIGEIFMGYEPASDDDMMIFNIDKEGFHISKTSNSILVKSVEIMKSRK